LKDPAAPLDSSETKVSESLSNTSGIVYWKLSSLKRLTWYWNSGLWNKEKLSVLDLWLLWTYSVSIDFQRSKKPSLTAFFISADYSRSPLPIELMQIPFMRDIWEIVFLSDFATLSMSLAALPVIKSSLPREGR
jgi:hypothetical protein